MHGRDDAAGFVQDSRLGGPVQGFQPGACGSDGFLAGTVEIHMIDAQGAFVIFDPKGHLARLGDTHFGGGDNHRLLGLHGLGGLGQRRALLDRGI